MEITVGELIERLGSFPSDATLYFSGLDVYRLKQRGEKLVQVEFNQPIHRDHSGQIIVENVA